MGGVVRRYIDFIIIILLIPTPLVLCNSFFVAASLLLCSFLNVLSFLFMLFLYNNYSTRCSKNIRDRSKIEITRTYQQECTLTVHARESQSFHMRGIT